MATPEPKITRLAPGEGAGDFKRKQSPDKPRKGGENMRSRTPKGQRRTQNPAILSDGSVDPRSSQYQRSVAGREKLEDYVKRLDSEGVEEKDIFMAAVNSLKNRGHGYVGAYLDKKNPSRRYNDVQAKAIADAVMSKADVGNNPGARLTKEDDDTKNERDEKRAASKESGSAPEPGRKAMPIRQQRREVVGQRKDEKGKIRDVRGRGDRALGMPETWAKADKGVDLTTKEARDKERAGWKGFDPAKSSAQRPEKSGPTRKEAAMKKEEEARKKGTSIVPTAAQKFQKALKQDPQPTQEQGQQLDELLAKREEMEPEEFEQAFKQLMEAVKTGEGGQREELRAYIQGLKGKGTSSSVPLPGSKAAAARDEKIKENQTVEEEKKEIRNEKAQAGREEAKKLRKAQKDKEEDSSIVDEIPEEEESGDLGNVVDPIEIGDKFRELFRDNVKAGLSTDPQSLVEETVEILNDDYGSSLSVDDAMRIVSNRFGARGIDGRRIQFPTQEAQGSKPPAGQPQQPSKNVKFTKPNFQREWDEAQRYPEFESAGIQGWIKAAEKGSAVKYSQIQDQLGNVDLDYDSLENEKKQRFEQSLQKGQIEAPIAVKFDDGSYDLVAGNTRLSGLVKSGVDPSIWVVGIKDLEQEAPAEQEQQQDPTPEETQAPARKKLDAERLGAVRARTQPKGKGGGGFTPEVKQASNTIKQAVAEGKTAQQVVEQFKQGNLFGKTGFDTEGDGPRISTESPEELAPASALPDENKPVAESPGQKTFLSKQKGKETQILPSAIQVPKPAQGVTDAKSYTKQLMDAGIPTDKINKAVKETYGSRSAKRSPKSRKVDSSEYQQFSDAVRQVVKLRTQQPIK